MASPLLRHGSGQLASAITLDFLAPSLLLRRSAHTNAPPRHASSPHNNAATSKSQKPHATSSSTRNKTLRTRPASSSNTTLPIMLESLKTQLQKYHHQLTCDLSDPQAEVFNQLLPEMREAAKTRDLAKAWTLWSTFKEKNLIRVFGPTQYDVYARFIATMFESRSPEEPLTPGDIEILEELAIATAVADHPAGLRAYMVYLIAKDDPDDVLRLFHRYLALMREKPRSGSSAQSSKNTEAEDEATGSGDKSKQPATTYVHGEMLIGAIAALAMRDSFTEAVEIILGTNRLPGPRLESLVQQLFAKPALRNKLQDKVKTYVRKLEAARLLSRPTALGLHLNNLANDRRDKHIQGIYESISEGLLGSQPWITLQESAVSPQTPVHLSEMTWSLFMTAFMRCRRTDLAGAVWDDMQKLGITPGVQIWNSLIDGYVELGDVEKAINTWNLMISQGCNPDALTYRAMLQALFNSHRSVDAMHRFREFEQNSARLAPAEDGVRLVVYNTVLSGLLWCKQEEEARSVLREMETRGPKPDIISINTFLKYYAAKGELNQLAATLDAIEPAGLKGDVFTFSIVLSALLKVRDDAADTVIKLMQKQGLEPNTATLSAIIDHLMKTQTAESFKTAFKILARMESNEFANAAPNEVTYTSMLASLHRADWLDSDTAREYTRIIWDKITSRRVQPSRVTYHVLLKACLDGSSAGGTQEALRYFRDMVSRRVRVTADTWYILLHKLMKRQEWEIAIVMAREMEDSGFEPNPALADLVQRIRQRGFGKLRAGAKAYI